MTNKSAKVDEKAFNPKFGEALRRVTAWDAATLRSETSNLLKGTSKQPDIFLDKRSCPPVVFECKFHKRDRTGKFTKNEKRLLGDAEGRLGLVCSANANSSAGETINFVVAVCYPPGCDEWAEDEIVELLLLSEELEWKFVRGAKPVEAEWWPKSGWLKGSVSDLAESASRTVASAEQIAEIAADTFDAVAESASLLASEMDEHTDEAKRIAETVGLPTLEEGENE